MRFHLKFKHIHTTVVRATHELFDAHPWQGTDEEKQSKFERWLQRASDAYGIPSPTLEIRPGSAHLQRVRMAYDLGQISLATFSVIELFHGFRSHMQALGAANVTVPEGEDPYAAHYVDAIGWACSLFYQVRPRAFRKAVRAGRILYVSPRELLSSETLTRLQAEQEQQWREWQQQREAERVRDDSAYDEDSLDDDEESYSEAEVFGAPVVTMLTTAEAAARIGVSTSRVLQLKEQLRGVQQDGRTWRFPSDAVDEYLASRQH